MVCDSIRLGKKAIGFPLCKPSLRMLAQPVLFPVAKSATLFEGNKTDVPEQPSSPINVASIAAEALAIAAKAAAADLDAGSGSSELLLQWRLHRVAGLWRLAKFLQVIAAAAVGTSIGASCPWVAAAVSPVAIVDKRKRQRVTAVVGASLDAIHLAAWTKSVIGRRLRAAMEMESVDPDNLLHLTLWWRLARLKRRRRAAGRREEFVKLPAWIAAKEWKMELGLWSASVDVLEILWPENWSLLEPEVDF